VFKQSAYAIHVPFVIQFLKKGNRNTKRLACTSLVRPVLEYGAVCWDPRREGQISALNRVQKEAAQFTNRKKDCDCETLAQRRTMARLWALFKAYSGEGVWKAIGDRLQRVYCLSGVDRVRKLRDRK